jgi:predicted DNA-binding ribbon-helix-helix protein
MLRNMQVVADLAASINHNRPMQRRTVRLARTRKIEDYCKAHEGLSRTSLKIEPEFLACLQQVAKRRGIRWTKMLNLIRDATPLRKNFASTLRVFALMHVKRDDLDRVHDPSHLPVVDDDAGLHIDDRSESGHRTGDPEPEGMSGLEAASRSGSVAAATHRRGAVSENHLPRFCCGKRRRITPKKRRTWMTKKRRGLF